MARILISAVLAATLATGCSKDAKTADPLRCAAGLVGCGMAGGGGYCADLAADVRNCGACGNACGPTEACRSGECDPCPVARCGGACTDTLDDPSNCGACGAAVPAGQFCENGAPLAKMAIELQPPLAAPARVAANSASMPFTVKVHSVLRVARVTLRVAADVPGLAAATPTDLAILGGGEVSPSTWSGSIAVPATGTSAALQIDAFDELYLPSAGTGGANAIHSDSVQLVAAITPVPTVAPSSIQATLGATRVGGGVACGGAPCMWVPLNAGAVTLSAQVTGAPGNGVAAVEFRNAPAGATSVLCPSRAFAAPGAAAAPCAQPVDGSGTATLSLAAAELGRGDVPIFACSLDATGLQYGPCAQMATVNACGSTGTSPCPGNLTVGRVASCPTWAPCAMPAQPVMARDATATPGHTLYYLAYADPPTNSLPVLRAQDADLPGASGTQQPGTTLAPGRHYFADGLLATSEGTGVYGVACSTCTGTPAGNTEIDRIDCPSTSDPACYRTGYVTAPGGSSFRQVLAATRAAMLLTDAAPPTVAGSGSAFLASALPAQTAATAVRIGTLLSLATVNGATASGSHWATLSNGAIVAWASSGGASAPVVYHPSLPGTHLATLPGVPGVLSALDLVAFPTGEIVYQATNDLNQRYLGAAWYDGSATPPKALATPVPLGPAPATGIASGFVVARPGVLLGTVPVSGSTTLAQALVIDLHAGSATAPATWVPSPWDGVSTGPIHPGATFARTGIASTFSVSDDATKAIYVTDDPPAAGQTATIWRLHLVDLAAATHAALAGSERMLCARTASGPTVPCLPTLAGASHYPRFVHGAAPWLGGAPTGLHRAVIWEEESPYTPNPVFRRARLWLAAWADAGAPGIASVDRLASYPIQAGGLVPITGAESAEGGALYFVSDDDQGGASLYAVPLTPPISSVVGATLLLDRVHGLRVREAPGGLLATRADGWLYHAPLAGGATGPLVPVIRSGLQGDFTFGVLSDHYAFGFTPDGLHAFTVADEEAYNAATVGFAGLLQTVELAPPYARRNWGRVAYRYTGPIAAGFLEGAGAVGLVDVASVEAFTRGRLAIARAANPTLHADTGLFSGDPTSIAFSFTPSLDGSEGLVALTGGIAAAVRSDGTLFSLPAASELPIQAATRAPFGGPFRPEHGQLSGPFFNGATGSLFKAWGKGASATTPPPFVSLCRGMQALPGTAPLQTRQTPDDAELLYSFVDAAESPVQGGWAIWLPLAGRAAPPPVAP
jgi:hypothetical protein